MKKNCLHCHFLAKEHRDETGAIHSFSLNEDERKTAEKSPENVIDNCYTMKCRMGVWDEGVSGSKKERNEIINLTQRNTGCFFFPYHPAMLFPAAEELQKRAEEHSQLKRSNWYTRIGLWVAAGALAVNALVQVLKQ